MLGLYRFCLDWQLEHIQAADLNLIVILKIVSVHIIPQFTSVQQYKLLTSSLEHREIGCTEILFWATFQPSAFLETSGNRSFFEIDPGELQATLFACEQNVEIRFQSQRTFHREHTLLVHWAHSKLSTVQRMLCCLVNILLGLDGRKCGLGCWISPLSGVAPQVSQVKSIPSQTKQFADPV